MNEQQRLAILADVKAVITDSHLVYTSGKHGSAYVNKDAIYPHTSITAQLCAEIAMEFRYGVDVVIAPAVGGVVLTQWTAYHLSSLMGKEVLAVYAEKIEGGEFIIGRGYDKLVTNKRILVVEDILNTGGSANGVIKAVRKIGGNIIGLGAICNRGGVTAADLGDIPQLFALTNIKLDAWDEADCPLCKEGVPINTEVGKGRAYLARKAEEAQAGKTS